MIGEAQAKRRGGGRGGDKGGAIYTTIQAIQKKQSTAFVIMRVGAKHDVPQQKKSTSTTISKDKHTFVEARTYLDTSKQLLIIPPQRAVAHARGYTNRDAAVLFCFVFITNHQNKKQQQKTYKKQGGMILLSVVRVASSCRSTQPS